MTATDSRSYCAAQVRRFDNDRYLASLFAPEDRRPGLLALYAFNIEIATTRESVSEPLLGEMRLQWWRETVEGIYGGSVRRHEVAAALTETIVCHGLPRHRFDGLIDARAFDLTDDAPADLAALESYAEATSASLVELALEVLGAGDGAAEAARHAGIGWALTGLLRAVPFHARARRLYLPADLMEAEGVSADAVFRLESSPGLAAVIERVAGAASGHIARARSLRREVPGPGLPAFLPLALADGALSRLARAGFDPFSPRIVSSRPMRALRLAAAALCRRY